MILLFPIGGILADRVNKRNIMVILDFGTSVLVLLFLLMINSDNMVLLISVAMLVLYAIQGSYQPAVQASIPALVEPESMIAANSIVDMISSLANMLGPVLGGLLYAFVGLSPILYVSAICFFVSAVLELFIHIPFQKRERGENIIMSSICDMKESLYFLTIQKPILLKIAISYGMISLFLCSLFNIALPVLFTQDLGFSENVANRLYGYSQSAIAIGSVLGGVFTGILSHKLKAHRIPYTMIGCGLCILVGGIALKTVASPMGVFFILTISCSILMILSTLFQIQMMSYVQILTSDDLIGKVMSCVICICMFSNPIGQFFYGIIFEHIGAYSYIVFCIAALIVIIMAIFYRKLFLMVEEELKGINY